MAKEEKNEGRVRGSGKSREAGKANGPLVEEGGEAVRRKRKEVPLKERTKEGRREA